MSNYDIQVNKEHYFSDNYNHKARWLSFFYQLKLLQREDIKKVLEIGPGNGWVTYILKDLGLKVTTVDIDKELKPDFVASVDKLPFPDNSFDVVCAFEVLEHMPFEYFLNNLKEMSRVSKKNVMKISIGIASILAIFIVAGMTSWGDAQEKLKDKISVNQTSISVIQSELEHIKNTTDKIEKNQIEPEELLKAIEAIVKGQTDTGP